MLTRVPYVSFSHHGHIPVPTADAKMSSSIVVLHDITVPTFKDLLLWAVWLYWIYLLGLMNPAG
jgi:hypothetical protein